MCAFQVYGVGVYGAGIRMYTLGWNNDVRIGIKMYAFRVYRVWGWNKDLVYNFIPIYTL